MKFLKKILMRGIQEIKNAVYSARATFGVSKQQVNNDVPYISQFAVPASAEATMKGELLPMDDPHWRESGALTPERYAMLASNICGMASAAMAIEFFKGGSPKPAALAEDALSAGVYQENKTGLTDMNYRKFAKWIQKFGLHADVYTRLNLRGIYHALSSGKLVMVSVNPNIRGYSLSREDQIGGHLVLVTGYDKTAHLVTINNPSGFLSTNSQKGHVLTNDQFLRYFAGRGIVLARR